MKVLGRIPGDEYVLDKTDGQTALKLAAELPSTTDEDTGALQLEQDQGSDRSGSIFISDGTSWNKVTPPSRTVGEVTSITCPREGCDVQIRWTDPNDVDKYVWKHTRLLRKYGTTAPTSIFDGVVVTDSYVRNQYQHSPFHDVIPAGTEDAYLEKDGKVRKWRYRFFVFSEDEVSISTESCIFEPIELSWANLPNIVRNGLATRVFQAGDIVKVGCKDGDSDEYYGNIEFEVAGFNQAVPFDSTLRNSLTFVSRLVLGHKCRWDDKWSEYQFTSDQYVTDRNKVYYVFNGYEYTPVTGLRIGSRIPDNTYYEKTNSEDRTLHGGNRWSLSMIRKWLNSTDSENVLSFEGEDASYTPIAPPLTKFPADVVNAIAQVRNKTALPSVDGSTYEVSYDSIYLLSATEVFGIFAHRSYFTQTRDKVPGDVYTKTADTVRDMSKTYYVKTGDTTYKEADNEFNEDGSFVEGQDYYEVYAKKYYLFDEEKLEYKEAKDSDFGDGHSFLPGVVYHELIVESTEENSPYLSIFYQNYEGDTELGSRIRTGISGDPKTWWLRSGNLETVTVAKAVDELGDIMDGGNTADSGHHLVIAFTVA